MRARWVSSSTPCAVLSSHPPTLPAPEPPSLAPSLPDPRHPWVSSPSPTLVPPAHAPMLAASPQPLPKPPPSLPMRSAHPASISPNSACPEARVLAPPPTERGQKCRWLLPTPSRGSRAVAGCHIPRLGAAPSALQPWGQRGPEQPGDPVVFCRAACGVSPRRLWDGAVRATAWAPGDRAACSPWQKRGWLRAGRAVARRVEDGGRLSSGRVRTSSGASKPVLCPLCHGTERGVRKQGLQVEPSL